MDVAGGNGSRERCLHILALSPTAEETGEAWFLKTTRKLTTFSCLFHHCVGGGFPRVGWRRVT
jgi:hypothetical protein